MFDYPDSTKAFINRAMKISNSIDARILHQLYIIKVLLEHSNDEKLSLLVFLSKKELVSNQKHFSFRISMRLQNSILMIFEMYLKLK